MKRLSPMTQSNILRSVLNTAIFPAAVSLPLYPAISYPVLNVYRGADTIEQEYLRRSLRCFSSGKSVIVDFDVNIRFNDNVFVNAKPYTVAIINLHVEENDIACSGAPAPNAASVPAVKDINLFVALYSADSPINPEQPKQIALRANEPAAIRWSLSALGGGDHEVVLRIDDESQPPMQVLRESHMSSLNGAQVDDTHRIAIPLHVRVLTWPDLLMKLPPTAGLALAAIAYAWLRLLRDLLPRRRLSIKR